MTTKVTEETRKEKKSTPETMLGWFILAPILLIAVAIIIAVWAKDSTKEVQRVTPTVAKRVESLSAMPTYGCGENVHIVAPVGRWSREVPQRFDCDFFSVRDPLPQASRTDRMRNLHGLTTVRINGVGGPEKLEGETSNGEYVDAYFKQKAYSMAFRSEEEGRPIHIIVQFLPK